jgi:DNA-binding MarR family transcriptional regulator
VGPFLRRAQIFATTVREVLELKLLREVSPHALSISQLHLLKLMSFNGRHQVGQIADILGVSAPAASKNIDKLEGLGLMVRTRSKGDRRATLISVSPEGRRLVEAYEHLKATRLLPVIGEFEPGELEQLSSLLERFAISLLEHESPEEEFCLRCGAYVEVDCPVGEVRGGCPFQKFHAAAAESGGGRDKPAEAHPGSSR